MSSVADSRADVGRNESSGSIDDGARFELKAEIKNTQDATPDQKIGETVAARTGKGPVRLAACVLCYKMRRRCIREAGSSSCNRCKQLQRECEPRHQGDKYVRKKTSASLTKKTKDPDTSDSLDDTIGSLVRSFDFLKILGTTNKDTENPTQASNESQGFWQRPSVIAKKRSVEASLAFEISKPWVMSMKMLNIETPPPSIRNFAYAMIERAKYRKSPSDLSVAMLFAANLNIPVDISRLEMKETPDPLPLHTLRAWNKQILSTYEGCNNKWAVMRGDGLSGERTFWSNSLYNFLFGFIPVEADSNPKVDWKDFWMKAVVKPEIAKEIAGKLVVSGLSEAGSNNFMYRHPEPVLIVDKMGYYYRVSIELGWQSALDGRLGVAFVYMKDPRPTDKFGASRIVEYAQECGKPGTLFAPKRDSRDQEGNPIPVNVPVLPDDDPAFEKIKELMMQQDLLMQQKTKQSKAPEFDKHPMPSRLPHGIVNNYANNKVGETVPNDHQYGTASNFSDYSPQRLYHQHLDQPHQKPNTEYEFASDVANFVYQEQEQERQYQQYQHHEQGKEMSVPFQPLYTQYLSMPSQMPMQVPQHPNPGPTVPYFFPTPPVQLDQQLYQHQYIMQNQGQWNASDQIAKRKEECNTGQLEVKEALSGDAAFPSRNDSDAV